MGSGCYLDDKTVSTSYTIQMERDLANAISDTVLGLQYWRSHGYVLVHRFDHRISDIGFMDDGLHVTNRLVCGLHCHQAHYVFNRFRNTPN